MKDRHIQAMIEDFDHKFTVMEENLRPYEEVIERIRGHEQRIEHLEQIVEVLRAVARDQEHLIKQLQRRQAKW